MKLSFIGLGFVLVTILLAPLAQAQSTKSGSTSNSTSSSQTSSASSAQGGTGGSVTVEQNYYPGGATGARSGASGASTSSSSSSGNGNYTATVHNTPDVTPPGQFGGTNPCAVGVSGGVSVAGVGIGGGGTWGSDGCERRNSAVILFQAGMPDVAVALLCQDPEIRQAFRDVGKPCPADRPAEHVAEVRPSDGAGSAARAETAVQAAAASIGQPATTTMPAWCNQPVRTEADQATYNYYCKARSTENVAVRASGAAGASAAAVAIR